MAQPKAIRELAKQTEQLEQELRTAQQAQSQAGNEPPPSNDPATPGAPAALPATAGPDVQDPLSQARAEAESWKQRLEKFRQSHDETVSSLRGQVVSMTSQVAQLTQQLQELRSQPAPAAAGRNAPAGAAVTDDDVLASLTPEQRELYDQGFIDVVARVAQKVLNRGLGDVSRKVETFETVIAENQTTKFWSAINDPQSGVPNWQELNAIPEFQTWVYGIEPLTGRVRNDLIVQAQKDLNPYPVIELYRQFLNQLPRPTPAPAPTAADPRMRQVVPDSSGSGGTGAPAVQTFRESEVNKFYSDVTRGVYKGKEDEARRIEQSIDAAARAGKIVPG